MIRDNLPQFVTNVFEMGDLIQAEQPEVTKLDESKDSMLDEFFIDTATETTIAYWEDITRLDNTPDWPIERRRERVKARLISSGQLTTASLKEVIERVGGIEVTITADAGQYKIIVTFVGRAGIPVYLDDIQREVDIIRPFHLIIEYAFTFAVLKTFEGKALNTYQDITLEEWSTMTGG